MIVVNWNGKAETLACLAATEGQIGEVHGAVITVVDNGSTDGSIAEITTKFPRVRFIPLGDLPARMHELDTADDIVMQCRSGVRSARGLAILQAAGFRKLQNLTGGILRWSDEVDPSIAKY